MDNHTPEQRSYNMAQVKGRNTKPELIVRRLLWHKGYRYRIHLKSLAGKPDIVFTKKKKVIFINGCFWHKHDCKHFSWPKTRSTFWEDKLFGNVKRDVKNYQVLMDSGWNYLILWECEIKELSTEHLLDKIESFLND